MYYKVWHEKGSMMVYAENEEEAIEAYYESVEGMIGHHLKICGCFGEKKPLDRSKVNKIIKIEEVKKTTR